MVGEPSSHAKPLTVSNRIFARALERRTLLEKRHESRFFGIDASRATGHSLLAFNPTSPGTP
jgi:hypothetical protein